MERETTDARTLWETPAITEIRVSAEVTAYVATSDN
jgi:coenzyme PQQ biosynthesis protein A